MEKTERLTIKVLPEHKLALERIAQAEDTSSAAIMRRLIRSEAVRRGVWPMLPSIAPRVATVGTEARP